MVSNCCVCGIEKGSMQDLNYSFHRFPKNEDLRLKWWEAIGRKVYRTAYICSKHFKAEDFKNKEDLNLIRNILKPSAVPSRHIKFREVKFEFVDPSSDDKDILTDNEDRNDESCESLNLEHEKYIVQNGSCDNRLQVNEWSISTSIDNPTSNDNLTIKTTPDNEATLSSTASQAKERKIKDDTLKPRKKQRYQNGILGIVRREDFTDENAWLKFQKYINKVKIQHKHLSQKNRKLQYEISICKELLKKQLSDDDLEI
ncbi:uncharacterized protein [Temnothorax longispinosus]|uniref:uncharacterized protein isoform X1 n=1 Tax=Temnothorax longispinosus TaxID=300112 RepID=UPI003A9A3965